MSNIVDLSQYQQKTEVVQPDAIWVRTQSKGVAELRFVGGPRHGTKALVPDEVKVMVCPGFFAGSITGRQEWPGSYLYEKVGDRMIFKGPTQHDTEGETYVSVAKASEMPAAIDWGPDAL